MIELEHVTKRYGSVFALKDVSFRVDKGGIVGLLGRNGAGKTTALNIMTGYLPPTKGQVRVGGENMLENPRACKRRIGYLPERPPLYDEMTVRDYLKFVCRLREVAPKAMKAHIDEIVSLCALEDVQNRVISHLSKGYRQRTGIAQALCGTPEVLILDEPTVGLDPGQNAEIRELIRALGRDHTVIFSSHILSEVQQLCSRVLILHEGRMIRSLDMDGQEDGVMRLRLNAAMGRDALLGRMRQLECVEKAEIAPDGDDVLLTCRKAEGGLPPQDLIFRALAEADAPIRSLSEERDNLEEVFLRATALGDRAEEAEEIIR